MRLASVAVFLAVAACAGAHRAPTDAQSVVRSEVMPLGYSSLGRVTVECGPRRSWASFRGASASSLFCDRPALDRALRELASERGGTVLAGQRCRTQPSGSLSCSATVARPGHEPTPARLTGSETPAFGVDSDALAAEVARRIAIDLEPAVPSFRRAVRSGAEVAEFVLLPVGHVELGVMRARCSADACDAEQARAGLRAAAGGLGVSDLIGVHCASLDGEEACVATLGATEADPETDPRAR